MRVRAATMIAALTSKVGGFLLAGIAIILMAWWAYSHVYGNGYSAAETHYAAVIAQMKADAATAKADEIERQDAANNVAKASEARRIAAMQAANEQLQSKIEELEREADEDPDAAKPVLGAASVRRINSVR